MNPLIEELCAENSFTHLDVIAAHRHHSDDVYIPKKHRVLRAPKGGFTDKKLSAFSSYPY